MAHVIAVAGKGGVGKTTLCGLLIQYLCESGKGPVLAVDADANSNLNEVLGVEVEATLGDIREEIARAEMASKNPIPAGMSKADYAEFKFAGALTEEDDFDLLVMLAKNKNIALTRDRLLHGVWGVDYAGETRTVDVHIGQLRKKLGLFDNIKTISKMGYRLED